MATDNTTAGKVQAGTLRTAILALPHGHYDLGGLYVELGLLLHEEFLRKNNLETLEEMIAVERQMVVWCRQHHDEHGLVEACRCLSASMVMRIEATGDDSSLLEVIELRKDAVELVPRGHQDRPAFCVHLSIALLMQYETSGEEATLQESLDYAEEAISLCPPGHPERALVCGNLARSLTVAHERSADDLRVLGRIIDLEREGLSLRDREDQSTLVGNLSASLYLYYQATGDSAHLNEAIALQRTAISLRTYDEDERVLSCLQLSPLLNARYELTSDVSFINEAIEFAREGVTLCPKAHRNRYAVCENLAKSIYLSCLQSGDGERLSEAVVLRRECLELRPPGHPDRLHMGVELASTLRFRYECTGDEALLTEAILVVEEVIRQCPDSDTSHKASALAQLASLVNLRFERTGLAFFLNEAILKIHEAITLRESFHPDYATWSGQLAVYLTTLYDRTGELSVLEYVIATERNILALHSSGNIYRAECSTNLAASLVTMYDVNKDSELITEVIQLCQQATNESHSSQAWRPWTLLCFAYLKIEAGHFDVNAAITSLTNALEPGAQGLVSLIKASIRILESIWSHVGKDNIPRSLPTVYRKLIHLLPTQANFTLDKAEQLDAVEMCTAVGSDAFVAAVSSGYVQNGLEMLECAQGIMWSQSLRQREPNLADLPEHLAKELGQLLSSVAVSGPRPTKIVTGTASKPSREVPLSQDARHQANARLDALLRQVREMPGLENFMLSSSYPVLLQAASDHPVVVLVAARARCYGMILQASCDPHLMMLDFDPDTFNSQIAVLGQRGTGDIGKLERAMTMSGSGTVSLLQRNLAILWQGVVKPIFDHLGLQRARGRARPRLHWCLTGKLSFIPFHAAGIYHGSAFTRVNCFDYVISSYSPSLSSLIRAQSRPPRLHTENIRLLLVAEKRPAEVSLATIPGVDEELLRIQQVANGKYSVRILGGVDFPGEATVDRVSEGIQTANIVHFACHGIQQHKPNPLEGGFCLSDGRLTLSKMMEMNLKDGFLAFCSACETVTGDRAQPDQAVHIAAAMLFSGFVNVIATMWAINDTDGPKIARWVYEELLQQEIIDSHCIAYALDKAVDNLRKNGVSPERWVPFVHVGA